MSKFMYNGKPYGGSTNYASSVTCTDAEGNESTVQAEIDKNRDDIDELNKKSISCKFVSANGTAGIKYSDEIIDYKMIYLIGLRPGNDDTGWHYTPIIDGRYSSGYICLDTDGHIGFNFSDTWGNACIIKLCKTN